MCMYVCVYGMVYTEEMVYTQQYGSCLCGIGRYWIRIRWSHTTRERKEVPKLQKKKKKTVTQKKRKKNSSVQEEKPQRPQPKEESDKDEGRVEGKVKRPNYEGKDRGSHQFQQTYIYLY